MHDAGSFLLFYFGSWPATLVVFGSECVKLYTENKKRRSLGNTELVCEATINWTVVNLIFNAICEILGGTDGGVLGSGGRFILNHLLLEIGVIPGGKRNNDICDGVPILSVLVPWSSSIYSRALPDECINFGRLWGSILCHKLIVFLKRASLVVFIHSGVIFASALTMGACEKRLLGQIEMLTTLLPTLHH